MITKAGNRRNRLFVGVDIGKDRLDVAAPRFRLSVENNREGWKKLIRETGKLKRHIHFVCEPIGHYGGAFIEFLHAESKVVSVVPGGRVRNFALATGRIAKTDKIDAVVLAEFGQTLRPAPTPKPKKVQLELRAIMRCRFQLVQSQTLQQRYAVTIKFLKIKRAFQPVIDTMRAQVKLVDKLARDLIAQDASLRRKYKAMFEVVGVGEVTARTILAEIPELGTMNRQQVAAIGGLAPFCKDSGASSAPRHIQGGRGRVRIGLFMSALAASQRNPVLAPLYRRLRARGKPHFVALTAVMRRLLIYLNSVVRRVEGDSLETANLSSKAEGLEGPFHSGKARAPSSIQKRKKTTVILRTV